ncbi:MAG TPA: hypothetical protein VJU82_05510, partial [Acidobacteriaceae bacterium]|nr:hypothetical protein [Acidobacteriaceae bacterium]
VAMDPDQIACGRENDFQGIQRMPLAVRQRHTRQEKRRQNGSTTQKHRSPSGKPEIPRWNFFIGSRVVNFSLTALQAQS